MRLRLDNECYFSSIITIVAIHPADKAMRILQASVTIRTRPKFKLSSIGTTITSPSTTRSSSSRSRPRRFPLTPPHRTPDSPRLTTPYKHPHPACPLNTHRTTGRTITPQCTTSRGRIIHKAGRSRNRTIATGVGAGVQTPLLPVNLDTKAASCRHHPPRGPRPALDHRLL